MLEYSCLLFAYSSDHLLKKIQAVETLAIKIAYRLAPWGSNRYCYSLVSFTPILERTKLLSKNFIKSYKEDDLIKPLIEDVKPSLTGHHSPLYKAIYF